MVHCSDCTPVTQANVSVGSSLEWSQSLVMACGIDMTSITSPLVSEVDSGLRRESTPGIRSLSLSVPIYERLLKENKEWLDVLATTPDYNGHASSEYRNDVEFLREGLTRALSRLSEQHGVHCSQNVVDVWLSEPAAVNMQTSEHVWTERYVSHLDSRASVVPASVLERRAEARGDQHNGVKIPG